MLSRIHASTAVKIGEGDEFWLFLSAVLGADRLMIKNNGEIGITRSDYIDVLETADDRELDPLVQFTASLHQRAIMQTVSE